MIKKILTFLLLLLLVGAFFVPMASNLIVGIIALVIITLSVVLMRKSFLAKTLLTLIGCLYIGTTILYRDTALHQVWGRPETKESVAKQNKDKVESNKQDGLYAENLDELNKPYKEIEKVGTVAPDKDGVYDFKLVKVKNLTLKYPGHFGTNIDFDIYKTDLDKDNKPYTLIYREDKLSYARDKNLKIEYKIGSDWSSMPLDIRDKNGDCTGTCGPYDDSYVTYEPFTETSPAHIHFYCACYKDQIEEIRFTLPMIRDTISERRVIKRNDHDSKLLPDYFEHREILTMKVPKK